MEMYPFKCRPIYKERIWGGRMLQDVYGKQLPQGLQVGESWELSDLPEDKTIIGNGPLAGQTLHQAIKQNPWLITGQSTYRPPLPLLIKFIDANDILSVQVHPDSNACSMMGKGEPKTECWYIIQAKPGAYIYKGVKPGTTKKQFQDALARGVCEQLLEKVEVQPGQCHFLPSGTCHAIGAGLLIAEIQQPSDTTYRVFDWNRIDPATGRARQLHIEEALESINFDLTIDKLPVRTVGRLVDSSEFFVDKVHQAAQCEMLIKPDPMKAFIFLKGSGTMNGQNIDPVMFNAGDTFLIPAAFEGFICFKTETELLIVTV